VLQHAEAEGLGTIAQALQRAGHSWRVIRGFAGEPVPSRLGDAAGLVALGGPMSVVTPERWPFLGDELRLIASAVDEAKPVLGICLGAQLLAAALGAGVRVGTKELGWHPVQLHLDVRYDPLFGGLEPTLVPLHWHRDCFDLPHGAVWLAHSARTRHQAFRFSANAYGVLFHLEPTAEIVERMLADFGADLEGEPDAAALRAAGAGHLRALEPLAARVFDGWAGLVKS
jgi:GMP synthase (glutamine-hydrolysing)